MDLNCLWFHLTIQRVDNWHSIRLWIPAADAPSGQHPGSIRSYDG